MPPAEAKPMKRNQTVPLLLGNDTRETAKIIRPMADLKDYWLVQFADGGRLGFHVSGIEAQ